ncbi:MAG: C4-dicarboxylate ABC transporter substrate-binding protein, partial [Rhodospirillaceae bacterium]|nr:C4-dicarboxylate ABC transporter substrate-binding protein [Rhodospirillaceae bacterium]
MKKYSGLILGIFIAIGLIGTAQAQVNLSAETAGPTGVPGNVMGHMADVLGEKKIANLQVAQGQTLTNSVR